MSLLGKAVVAIWNDILPEGRENFIEWHNREHIPERVAIPGFLRGRRYVAEQGTPEYFTLYEAADAQVLVGQPYLERLNSPTPWTKKSTADFRNTTRGVCNTEYSHACGDGGFIATFRFDAADERKAALQYALLEALTEIGKLNGVSGVHLCIADNGASSLATAERKGRQVGVPNWIILIEGGSALSVTNASDALAHKLSKQELTGSVESGLYRLEFSLGENALQQSAA
ncbi:hypothetical protein EXN24_18430 [Rhizobium rhizogenes]|uniref:Uncharacterized protein n=1 Tax=Rhizobium rhizogenes TaxID=359 RepID=A0AA94VB38_RHIRH|nr:MULTISPECIES: DUF4286 family protein [Rhizobium/Agrobacterium group]ADY66016.1 hypothetical protein AGROH133_09945 [Agrobacterium tumefaciens]TRA87344.1 hypothetical protein EXN24_18430 [Rhizobium rhizogenes]